MCETAPSATAVEATRSTPSPSTRRRTGRRRRRCGALVPWDLERGHGPPVRPTGCEDGESPTRRPRINDVDVDSPGRDAGRQRRRRRAGARSGTHGWQDTRRGSSATTTRCSASTSRRTGAAWPRPAGTARISVWDADTGEPLQEIAAHEGGVWDVAFSPDGTTCSQASARTRWSACGTRTRRGARRCSARTGHTDLVFSATFDPDGELLATTSADGTTIVWDVDDREVVHRFDDHDGPVLERRVPSHRASSSPRPATTGPCSSTTSSTGDLERRIELPSAGLLGGVHPRRRATS